jgi:hypothetical protein
MGTPLPKNEFIPNSSARPATEGSAAAKSCPQPRAAAALHSNSALASAMTADTDAAPDLTDPPVAAAVLFADPDGGYMSHGPSPALGTSVGIADADSCQEPASASPINHINEIFHYARKLMRGHQGFVLDEAAFMADVEEVPLFIRSGDHLRRWEA